MGIYTFNLKLFPLWKGDKLIKQLENIKRPGLYDYRVKNFSKEQKKKLDRLKISSLMITGKLFSIESKSLKRYKKTEELFTIIDKKREYGLIFKFKAGVIELLDILEPDTLHIK